MQELKMKLGNLKGNCFLPGSAGIAFLAAVLTASEKTLLYANKVCA